MSTDPEAGDNDAVSNDRTITVANDGTVLPVVEVLTGRGFITGKSGAGKSNTASVVAEELLEQGFPLLIVDVDGEYYGLKERYEMLHVGDDEECDLRVGQEHAGKLAELALDKNVPIILDVSSFLDETEAADLIKGVAKRLFALEKKRKKPFLMLVEEIHEYIPEGGALDECGRMLIKVAKRGRKHGLGLCGVSQRPADVKKDFITQCDWLVWHRLTWDNDTAVVRRVLDASHADAIQTLNDGEAFLMTDWDGTVRRMQFKRKRTFDAGATPGLNDFEQPDLKSVSAEIVTELKEISERHQREQDKLAQLRQQLEQKDATISELREDLERAQDVSNLADQFTQALARVDTSDGTGVQETLAELREEKNDKIRELTNKNEQLRERNVELEARVTELENEVEATAQFAELEANIDEATEAYERLGRALGVEPQTDETERLRDRVGELEQKLAAQRATTAKDESDDTSIVTDEIETYRDFITDDAVSQGISRAKEAASSPRYVEGTISCIIEAGEPVRYDDIAEHLDITSTSHVGVAVNALVDEGVVKKETRGGRAKVDLAIEDLGSIRQRARRRAEAASLLGN